MQNSLFIVNSSLTSTVIFSAIICFLFYRRWNQAQRGWVTSLTSHAYCIEGEDSNQASENTACTIITSALPTFTEMETKNRWLTWHFAWMLSKFMTFFHLLLKHHFPKKDFCGSSNLIQSTCQYSHEQFVLRTIRKKWSLSHEKKWMKAGYLICCHGSLATLSLAERVGTTFSVSCQGSSSWTNTWLLPWQGKWQTLMFVTKAFAEGERAWHLYSLLNHYFKC